MAGAFLMVLGLLTTLFAFVAQPAAAVVVPTDPSGALTGFEIEGDQDDDAAFPAIDWDTADATIVEDDTLDTGLRGTSKENDPSDFVCDFGGDDPGKDNILGAAVSSRLSDDAAFLDMSYVREVGQGDAHVNFEFNQGATDYDCVGREFVGRVDGDVLFAFDFPGGSNAPDIDGFIWDSAVLPGDNAQDGSWVQIDEFPPGAAAGSSNSAAIPNLIFGAPVPATLAARTFGEISLDIEAIFPDLFEGDCVTFGTLNVRSRSSGESFNSALQDRLEPAPIDFSTCGSITIKKTDDAGNPLAGAQFGLFDNATATGAPVATCISDAAGICSFPDLDPGTYWIKEITAPAGYDADPAIRGPIVVEPLEHEDLTGVPFVDPRQVGFVRINKTLTDAAGGPLTGDSLADLNGATFVLQQGGVVASLWPTPPTDDPATCTITNSQGFCTIGPVPIGSYQVVETVAPPGTTVGPAPGPVNVTEGTVEAPLVVAYPNISETPTITIAKTANPTEVLEPGGSVVFSVSITNTSVTETLTLDSLVDDVFGDLLDGGNGAVTNNTCAALAGDSLAPGANVTCSFTGQVLGNAGDPAHVNVVEVVGSDDEGQTATDDDDATVDFDDLAALVVEKTADPTTVLEPGSDVTFTVQISNSSDLHPITLTSIMDDVFGDLGDAANPDVSANTCVDLIGDVLPPLGSTSCTFDGFVGPDAVTGDPAEHQNTVTVAGVDDEGTPVDDDDDAIVDIEDVMPGVVVTKTANDNSIPENTPTAITFTVVVTNDSVEPVTILSLDDDVFGAQVGDADCQVGTTLPVDGSCTFTFVGVVGGDFQDPAHTNTFTVVVRDDEGNLATDDDPESVGFENVPPTVLVDKTAEPISAPENTPTDVLYTVTVTNTSNEPVMITSLDDDVFGPLAGDADCQVGTLLAVGASCTFTFVEEITGDAGVPHTNVVTVVVIDDDESTGTDSDDATVDFEDVPPTVVVDKSALPVAVPENTPTDVVFTVVVTNTSNEAVTITSLDDDVFGPLAGDADCQVGTLLAIGASCTFTFTAAITGDASGAPHTNVVTVVVSDNDGSTGDDFDDATVTFTNVLPTVTVDKTAVPGTVPENTPTDVVFTVVVTNTSNEAVTITSLDDDVFGPLAGDADCQVGTLLAVGASCTFSFTEELTGDASGDPHTNVVTVVVTDDDDSEGEASDPATVGFDNIPPTVEVDKAAEPTSVPENTPTDVVFTVTVTNTSNEPVTITSLEDDVFGSLVGDDDCEVGTELGVGESCEFTFTEELTGDASGDPHTNVVTVVVIDDDESEGEDSDDETVTFTDVPPTVTVTKDSDTNAINDGSSAQVTFTVVVTNGSAEPVTITTLSDSVFGVLDGDADCKVGTELAVGGSCTFTFTKTIAGNVATPHSNVVTVVVTDDEGTTGTDTDDETIPVNPTTTTTTAPTEVAGVQQEALPRTGTDSSRMLFVGLGILSLGAGLVLLSAHAQQRRRFGA